MGRGYEPPCCSPHLNWVQTLCKCATLCVSTGESCEANQSDLNRTMVCWQCKSKHALLCTRKSESLLSWESDTGMYVVCHLGASHRYSSCRHVRRQIPEKCPFQTGFVSLEWLFPAPSNAFDLLWDCLWSRSLSQSSVASLPSLSPGDDLPGERDGNEAMDL